MCIFRAEFNSKRFGLPYFQLRQVNITYKYAAETFDWNQMFDKILFGIPEGMFLITKPLNHLKELVLNAYYTLIYILLRNKCFWNF